MFSIARSLHWTPRVGRARWDVCRQVSDDVPIWRSQSVKTTLPNTSPAVIFSKP